MQSLVKQQKIIQPRFAEIHSMKDKSLDQLLRVKADATQTRLNKQGLYTMEICMQPESVQDFVELKMSMMISVGVLGEILNLNVFDQPGVKLGKQMTKQLLANLKA